VYAVTNDNGWLFSATPAGTIAGVYQVGNYPGAGVVLPTTSRTTADNYVQIYQP